jgi:hypothetical protein
VEVSNSTTSEGRASFIVCSCVCGKIQ